MLISFSSEGIRNGIDEDNREVTLKIRNISKTCQFKSKYIEIVSQKHDGNDFEVKIRIQNYPSSFEIRIEDEVAIDRHGFTDEMLFNYLKRCDINTHAKPAIYAALTSIPHLKRVEELIKTNLLDEEIRIDLLSEIGDFGFYHYTKEMGKNVFVVWNTGESEYFNYVFKKFPINNENSKFDGNGKVPKALIYDVEKNTSEFVLHWPAFEKVESRFELRFGDIINRVIDFDKLSHIKNK